MSERLFPLNNQYLNRRDVIKCGMDITCHVCSSYFPANNNINKAVGRNCKKGATLGPINIWPKNLVW